MNAADLTSAPAASTRPQFLAAAALGLAFAAGILLGLSFLNGPWYWKWPWRDLGLGRVVLLNAAPLALLAAAFWKIQRFQEGASAVLPLGLLVVAGIGLQSAGVYSEPGGPGRIRAIVESPLATSYYTDAVRVSRQPGWLSRFHADDQLKLHSSTHPPGPILYYLAFLRLFGTGAALAGGLTLGLLTWAALPLLYRAGVFWGLTARERLTACAFYCLLPSLTVFLPEFDTVYPVFTLATIGCWIRALEGKRAAAVGCGASLFLSTMFAYNLLTLGTFLAGYLAYAVVTTPRERRSGLFVGVEVAVLSFLGFHALFGLATGYDAVASFRHATSTQSGLAATYDRHYWPCILFDLYDFALGAGFLLVPLTLCYAERFLEEIEISRRDLVVGGLGLATILATDLSGLLRAETARVWIFLLPLLLLPALSRFSRFSAREQGSLLALQALLLLVLRTRLGFLSP